MMSNSDHYILFNNYDMFEVNVYLNDEKSNVQFKGSLIKETDNSYLFYSIDEKAGRPMCIVYPISSVKYYTMILLEKGCGAL